MNDPASIASAPRVSRSLFVRRRLVLLLAPIAGFVAVGRAAAQTVNLDFPPVASGYDQQLGVTVQSRPRDLYTPLGIDIDGFEIRPDVEETIGYNSNPTASATAVGSAVSHTTASVSAASMWSRDSLSAQVGTDHYSYFGLSGADYTDWNVGLRGGYTLGDSDLAGAYAHQSYHQLGATVGTVRSNTPVADTTDTGLVNYTFKFYRIDVTPDFSASAYRYGAATVDGTRVDQRYLDRNVLAGGITTRVALNAFGGLLLVARATDSDYIHNLPGQPNVDSRSVMLLSGIDYQAAGPWRYRVLVGAQVSIFTAAQYSTRITPVVEADVTWTPTGLTTVTGSVRREINDPLAAGSNGYVSTAPSVRIDHELMRNVILQGHGGVQFARYLEAGGAQTEFDLGAGVNWLINRDLRLGLTYDYTWQSATTGIEQAAGVQTPDADQFSQSVIGLTLVLSL